MPLGSNTSGHIFDTTFTTNGPLYSAASGVVTSGVAGSAGQVYQSAGAGSAPGYSTATYPATATGTGTILRADGTNWSATTATYPNTAGTAGKVLISDGTNIVSSTPTFPNASATAGKFIRSDGTNWIASTPTLPTSAGTTGKILQSDGTNYVESTPTYPSASGSAGKILRADGTNNVYSTATYPDTAGTSGNVLTSDGTNWSSSAPSAGAILTAEIKLTSAQIKALHATPIAIVAAPGLGKVIMVINAIGRFTYGGTNAFTAGASQSIDLYLGTAAAAKFFTLLANANVTSTVSGYCYNLPTGILLAATASFENQALNLYNPIATEITGNAANNNTFDVSVAYYIVTLT